MSALRPTATPPVLLEDVISVLRAAAPLTSPGLQVTGITHDSRQVEPGDLYAALPGAQAHGAAFSEQAAGRGAAAILTDRLGAGIAARVALPVLVVDDPRAALGVAASLVYGHPSAKLAVFGVTGTNGKTTTAYLLDAGLRGAGAVTGVIGTIETRIAGVPVPSQRTTPEATDLQALLAVMVERGVTAVAMEVSSHALALGRVTGTKFRAGIFTNLSQDHLDFHASMQDYFQIKASLFDRGRCELAVIDIDDAWGCKLRTLLAERESAPPVLTVGTGRGGDGGAASAPDWTLAIGAGGLAVAAPDGEVIAVPLQLLGSFNGHNAALALATLAASGLDPRLVAAGIGALAGVPGRMERVDVEDDVVALVDYAHTPDAVVTLLGAIREFTDGRLIAVLGCGGDRDRGKRPLMGEAVARHADIAILTDDNPRSEPSAEILHAMEIGAFTVPDPVRAQLFVEPDRAAAIALAVRHAEPGDTVVVAGKGHETGQDVRGQITPFDDRTVLRQTLERRRQRAQRQAERLRTHRPGGQA